MMAAAMAAAHDNGGIAARTTEVAAMAAASPTMAAASPAMAKVMVETRRWHKK